jgi:hypothetical protein
MIKIRFKVQPGKETNSIEEKKIYLVSGHTVPSFFTTCKTKHDNISTIFITKSSSSKRSTINFSMLKP